VKLTRFRNSKIACFLPYVEYRRTQIHQYYLKKKQVILLGGHIQEREGKRKKLIR
jgi:hypothetical protein